MMRIILNVAVMALLFVLLGCQGTATSTEEADPDSIVPYISANEVADTLAANARLLLVEFCVPVGCFRCDEMREQIDQLASDERERLTIRRVNLNEQPALARQLGISVCPSYIAFRDGQEVFRAAYPTSSDLIVAGLDESLRNSSAE